MKDDKIIRNRMYCNKCHTIVESKSVHDYQECPCGNFTDGGTDYIRRGGNLEDIFDVSIYIENGVYHNNLRDLDENIALQEGKWTAKN